MKSPYWPLFEGKINPRAVGFLALITTSIFCLCLAQTAPDDSSAPAAPVTPSYEIVDLGTLGGSTTSAAAIAGQQGHNAAGMIVGASNAADNSAHAFLYSNGQMFDLNELCDLPRSNFNVLTVATSIDDAGQIIGEGVTTDGQNHAFLLTPTPVDGGNWSYNCCQWIWKQQADTGATQTQSGSGAAETGWWWESDCHCYKWHGRPGKHPACPTNPPHCWGWPLPCPPDTGSTAYPHSCWCCLNGQVIQVNDSKECSAKGGQCFPSKKAAEDYCRKKMCWCCFDGGGGKGKMVAQLSEEECKKRRGQCYASQDQAQKHCTSTPTPTPTATPTPTPTPGTQPPKPPGEITKEKFPPLGWCCKNGAVSHITRGMCETAGGQFYGSEAEAESNCASNGYCCYNDTIEGIVGNLAEIKAECHSIGGTYWPTYHQALENCGPTCWCCAPNFPGGMIFHVTRTDCSKTGATCHETLAQAQADCPGAKIFPLDAMKGSFQFQNPPLRLPKPGSKIVPPMPQDTSVPNNPRIPLRPTNTPGPQVTPFISRLPRTKAPLPKNPRFPGSQTNTPVPQATLKKHSLPHTSTQPPATSSRSPSPAKHRLPRLKPPPTPPIIR